MSFSFEQPELYSDYIVVSSPRVFIRPYASTVLFSGQQILSVSSPLSGWSDVGLISNVQIPVTRNITKFTGGIPKTTRKSFEASREAQVTLTYHEMAINSIANLIGVTQTNVISMASIVSCTNTTNATFTLGTSQEANRFVVGDVVTFWDASADALDTQEKTVTGVNITTKIITVSGEFASTLPETGDILIAKAGTVASYSGANKTATLSAGDANRFVASDRVVYLAKAGISGDNLSALRTSTDRTYVTSVDAGGAILNLAAAFSGTPVATDIVVAYRSIEMLDPLGTIAEKSILVFFDWVINSVQRQFAIWYPKVTVSGSFAPDFKGGENFMDASITFEAQSTSQVMTDGVTHTVLSIPFMYD
jgi:hypothetical protein